MAAPLLPRCARALLRRTAPLRSYTAATSTPVPPPPPRQQISVRAGGESAKRWAQLSGGQKIVRSASTGFNGAVVAAGLLLTVRGAR